METVDSVFTAAGPAYRDCDVTRPARLRREVRPATMNLPRKACMIAELEFVVDTAGTPEVATARVHRTDTPEYAAELLRGLDGWRYQPAELDGARVRQVVRARQALAAFVRFEVREPTRPGVPGPPPRVPATCR